MTPEQQFLLEKAQRSLAAARQLLQQEFYDFSVSRAYYNMFYVAEALLDKEGLSFSSHAAVISAFGRELSKPQKVPQEFHRYLIDAQALITIYGQNCLLTMRRKQFCKHNHLLTSDCNIYKVLSQTNWSQKTNPVSTRALSM